jgi:hypothetical protein
LTFWRDWTGLPWQLGADPRHGRGACCFRTAQAVRECLGLPWPADRMKRWYADAEAGLWAGLRDQWDEMTDAIEQPEPGALVRFDNPNGAFGVGVLPDHRTLITVRHNGRLIVGPISALAVVKLFTLK